MRHLRIALLSLTPFFLAGCGHFTVTKVTPQNDLTVSGARYYLPKPFIQVIPLANGTVQVGVIYLPDKSKEYAVDASAGIFSSYSFQILTDPTGVITGLEYGPDSTAVAAQVASTAGGVSAQAYNLRMAQNAAAQTQVNAVINSAQNGVITAEEADAAARATLAQDTSAGSSSISADQTKVSAADATLQAANSALVQARATAQAATATASAGTPITPTSPAAGSLTASNYTAPTQYDLPERFSPALYEIDETTNLSNDKNGWPEETLELKPVTGSQSFRGSPLGDQGVSGSQFPPQNQTAFPTITMVPPAIPQPAAPFASTTTPTIQFEFNKAVLSASPMLLSSNGTQVALTVANPQWDKKLGIAFNVGTMTPGGYELVVAFTYAVDWKGTPQSAQQVIPFVISPPPVKP